MESHWPPGEHRRYLVENEVQSPQIVWFYASRNKDARVYAWQVRAVVDCTLIAPIGKRADAIACDVESIAIRAAAMPGDQGSLRSEPLLPEILVESDERLTAATLEMVLRHDGRLTQFEIRGLPRTERREGLMAETLRIVMLRAFSGFDIDLPREGLVAGGAFSQIDSLLFAAPTQSGTLGSAQFVHSVETVDEDRLGIASLAKGTIQINDYITLSASHHGRGVYTDGGWVERWWFVFAEPTPGSFGNEGTQAVPYYQYGHLRRLDAVETVDVGPSEEVVSIEPVPTSLTAFTPMGMPTPAFTR